MEPPSSDQPSDSTAISAENEEEASKDEVPTPTPVPEAPEVTEAESVQEDKTTAIVDDAAPAQEVRNCLLIFCSMLPWISSNSMSILKKAKPKLSSWYSKA